MIRLSDKQALIATQRWQRALAHWDRLGFHSRVYYLQGHLQDEARKASKPLSGAEAYNLARLAIEAEETPFLAEIDAR